MNVRPGQDGHLPGLAYQDVSLDKDGWPMTDEHGLDRGKFAAGFSSDETWRSCSNCVLRILPAKASFHCSARAERSASVAARCLTCDAAYGVG